MPDLTPCDPHFLAWWRILTTHEPDDLIAYAQRATFWAISMAVQRKLGAIPGPDDGY